MEIPFIVNARKDTGLFNSKVGIWLFLASEVTLFGGLFSGYLFLRLYADYPWPERALPVLPGLINTFVLIGSSVTVVFAWAALKMREWKKFQIYMSITLLCAALFMVLKGIEYKAKFGHQAVQIEGSGPVQDRSVVEGHLHPSVFIGNSLVEDDSEAIEASIKNQSFDLVRGLREDKSKAIVEFLTAFKPLEEKRLSLKEQQAALGETKAKLEETAEASDSPSEDLTEQLNKVSDAADLAESVLKETNEEISELKGQFATSKVTALVVEKTDLQKEPAVIAASLKDEDLLAAAAEDIRATQIEVGYANKIIMKAKELTFVLTRPTHEAYVAEILEQAGEGVKITLAEDYRVIDQDQLYAGEMNRDQLTNSDAALVAEAGTPLSIDLLEELEDAYLEARSHDREVRTQFLAASWDWVRNEMNETEAATYVVEKDVWKERRSEDAEKLKILTLRAPSEVTFNVEQDLNLVLDPGDLVKVANPGSDSVKLRDDTLIGGKVLPSPILMGVDALDFRDTALRAEAEGLDPFKVIEETWILNHEGHHDEHAEEGEHAYDDGNEFKRIWACHMAWLEVLTTELKDKDREPTANDKFRVNWDQILAYRGLEYDVEKVKAASKENTLERTGLFDLDGFAGANHKIHEFPHLEVPRDKVGFESTFTPKWNTYYAIYFTITGLHGLHVIGGAIVLGYYLFFGRKMYESNPEWLANRVEVGGLFWHFVDLVWIFLFPILYLM